MLEPRHARDLRCTLYWGLYAQGLQCTFSPVVRYKMLAVVQYSVFALGSAVYRVAGKALSVTPCKSMTGVLPYRRNIHYKQCAVIMPQCVRDRAFQGVIYP